MQAGGLWQEAQDMYRHYGATFRHQQMVVTFPSGAEVQFKVMAHDRDTSNFDGGQYSMVVFDECQWHSQVQFLYLLSRLRSKANCPHQLFATCNPLKTSFLLQFVQYCLDEQGVPIRSMAAKKRYFAEYSGSLVFADTAEELLEKYPSVTPTSYTFHPANVFDNSVIMKTRPDYVNRLKNLKRVERLRLLDGSWYAQAESDGYWKRDWCEVIDYIPLDTPIVSRVRAWDLAASPEPSESATNRDPDFTAGVLLARDKSGTYYVEDVVRFRKSSGDVLQSIINQSFVDGEDVTVVIPRDSSGGGVSWHRHMILQLAEAGIGAKTAKVSGHVGKLQRFLPFASMSEAGNVKIVRGDWNDIFFEELENFIGGGRNQKGHDDITDACADAFNSIAKQMHMPSFTLPDLSRVSNLPF